MRDDKEHPLDQRETLGAELVIDLLVVSNEYLRKQALGYLIV